MTSRAKVQLIDYEHTDLLSTFTYNVTYSTTTTTLEQFLTIKKGVFDENWCATITLDDFPYQKSPQEAAYKLAEWLEQLAKAIKSGSYDHPTQSKWITLEDN